MRPSDLDTLELPRLLGALSAHAASSAGREACLALRPRLDVRAVRDELARVARFRAITEDEPAPLGDFPDVRPLVAESRTGGARLSGEELREIASVLRTVGAMRVFLRARAPGDPGFLALAGSLHSMPELERLLADSIDAYCAFLEEHLDELDGLVTRSDELIARARGLVDAPLPPGAGLGPGRSRAAKGGEDR